MLSFSPKRVHNMWKWATIVQWGIQFETFHLYETDINISSTRSGKGPCQCRKERGYFTVWVCMCKNSLCSSLYVMTWYMCWAVTLISFLLHICIKLLCQRGLKTCINLGWWVAEITACVGKYILVYPFLQFFFRWPVSDANQIHHITMQSIATALKKIHLLSCF